MPGAKYPSNLRVLQVDSWVRHGTIVFKTRWLRLKTSRFFTDRYYWWRRSWRHLASADSEHRGHLANRFVDVVVAGIAYSRARRNRRDDRRTEDHVPDLARRETGSRTRAVCRPRYTVATPDGLPSYLGLDCRNLATITKRDAHFHEIV